MRLLEVCIDADKPIAEACCPYPSESATAVRCYKRPPGLCCHRSPTLLQTVLAFATSRPPRLPAATICRQRCYQRPPAMLPKVAGVATVRPPSVLLQFIVGGAASIRRRRRYAQRPALLQSAPRCLSGRCCCCERHSALLLAAPCFAASGNGSCCEQRPACY
jgi:hypothetical protein